MQNSNKMVHWPYVLLSVSDISSNHLNVSLGIGLETFYWKEFKFSSMLKTNIMDNYLGNWHILLTLERMSDFAIIWNCSYDP